MTLIDMDTITTHCVLDLVDDRLSRCFNTQHLLSFQNMVRCCEPVIDTRSSHYFPQAIAFNQKLMLVFIFLLFANNCTHNLRDTFNYHMRQFSFELLHHKVHLLPRFIIRFDVKRFIALKADMTLFYLQL